MSTASLQELHNRVKGELQRVEARLSSSRTLLSNPVIKAAIPPKLAAATAAAKPTKEEAAMRDEVLQSLGQLYLLFSSRSTSVASSSAAAVAAAPVAREASPTPNTNDVAASPQRVTFASAVPDDGSTSASQTPLQSPQQNEQQQQLQQQRRGLNNDGVDSAAATPVPTPTVRSGTPPPSKFSQNSAVNSPANSRSGSAYAQPGGAAPAAALATPTATPTSRSSSVQGVLGQQRPPPPPAKGGVLYNYGLPSILRSFKQQYVLIETDTVKWYKSEENYTSGGAPVGAIPLHTVQKNSRGSVIKQVAACWPFITTAECPKATDNTKHYFGIQYFDDKGQLAHLVLAATSPDQKREWVQHLAQLIPLHLPPDAPNMFQGGLYIDMAQCTVPHHAKTVLDGEAPKH